MDKRSVLLRWRARAFLRWVSPRVRAALRLAPALFQANFPRGPFRENAPGVEGLTQRTGWGDLARGFGLVPPSSGARGRASVAALVCTPTPKGATLWVLPRQGLRGAELNDLQRRYAEVEKLLGPEGVSLAVLGHPGELGPDAVFCCYGALLAGLVPAAHWVAPETSFSALSTRSLAALVERAPTALCQQLALLLGGRSWLPPAELLRRGLEQGLSARTLADPEVLLTLWVQHETRHGPLAVEALALAGSSSITRDLAREMSAVQTYGSPHSPLESKRRLTHLLSVARQLAKGMASAVRVAPREVRASLKQTLRREVLATGVPSVLLPVVREGLAGSGLAARSKQATVFERKAKRARELRDASGAVLGRGATLEQARIRGLALITQALGKASAQFGASRLWKELGARLAEPVSRRTLLAVVFASPDKDGGRVRFSRALWVLMRPGARPSSGRWSAADALAELAREVHLGATIDIVAADSSAQPTVQRLTRLVATLRERPGVPYAVQNGDEVLFRSSRGVRRFPLARFALRPRECLFLSADDCAPLSCTRASLPLARVECQARLMDDGRRVELTYLSENRWMLREDVPLAYLEAYLAEAQVLLRARESAALLDIRAHAGLETASRKAGTVPVGAELGLRGSLPFGLQVAVGKEWFGGSRLGLEAAAQAVLSRWPVGFEGRLAFREVDIEGEALEVLYARSAVRRRLEAHMRRLSRR